ncbi:MAG: hypothetical protein ABJK37_01300 [Paraglaciecola sp.]|uniref:hypothetical protein n=1 Tax=Paraglaciecola sp. TaxID=1920173 RepID=UPI0032998690
MNTQPTHNRNRMSFKLFGSSTNLPEKPGEEILVQLKMLSEKESKADIQLIERITSHSFFNGTESEINTFDYYYEWYETRKERYRMFFYIFNISILLIGFSYSVATDSKLVYEHFWLPLSVLLTSFLASFGILNTWRGYYLAMKKMESLYDLYILELLTNSFIEDGNNKKLIDTTTQFISSFHTIIEEETKSFFNKLTTAKIAKG